MSEKSALPSSRWAVPAAACALLCGAAPAQERGRLVGVEASGDAGASSVELIADRPLSFTTLKLHGPPRVVVDFADTELSGIARETPVDDGTIRRVAAAAAGQRTARVVIELAAEAEFDVRAQGNRVQVRVPRIAPLVAAAEGRPGTPEAPAAPPEAAPPAPPSAEASAPAAPPAVAASPGSGERPLPASLAGPHARPAEDAAARQRHERQERAAAAQKAARDRRLAAAEKAAAEQRARKERAVAQRLAKAAAKPAPQRKLAMTGALRSITGIGFRPLGAGEVIVRSDHPLEYGVSDEGGAVLLHLPKAAIPLPNNRRELDTQFFNGAVRRIVPLQLPGGTDLRIELRGRADYQLAQSGGVLTVTFSAPR